MRRFEMPGDVTNFIVSERADRVVAGSFPGPEFLIWRLSDGVLLNRAARATREPAAPGMAFINDGAQFVTAATDWKSFLNHDVAARYIDGSLTLNWLSVFDSASGSLIRHVPSVRLARPEVRGPLRGTSGPTMVVDITGPPETLLASRDGRVLVGHFPHTIHSFLAVYDTTSFTIVKTIYFEDVTRTHTNFVALSDDGRSLAVAGDTLPAGVHPPAKYVIKLDLESLSEQSRAGPYLGDFRSVALRPDGDAAVTTNQTYKGRIFRPDGPDDITELRVSEFLPPHETRAVHLDSPSIPTAAWSEDGRWIFAGYTHSRRIVLLDAATLSVADSIPAWGAGPIRRVPASGCVAYADEEYVKIRTII